MLIKIFRTLKTSRPTQVSIAGVLIFAILMATRPETPPEPAVEKAWIVDVLSASPSQLSPTLQLFGQVQSPEDAMLSAGIEAVITEVLVQDGQSVPGGALLAKLDDREARLSLMEREAELNEAKAKLNLAERQASTSREALNKELRLLDIRKKRYARSENLYKQKSLSKNDLESASENLTRQELTTDKARLAVDIDVTELEKLKAQINRLQALRDKAQLDVERTLISAPFPGVISELDISIGDRVRNGDSLMRLQNPATVEIRAQIPLRHAMKVRDSLDGTSIVSAMVRSNGANFYGELRRISGLTRQGTGGVDAFIGFGEVPFGLTLGSTVQVTLNLPADDNVIAVPTEALYGSNELFKVVDDRMQLVNVERVGEQHLKDGKTRILVRSDNIKKGDNIIITKLANASDGLKVEVASGKNQLAADNR